MWAETGRFPIRGALAVASNRAEICLLEAEQRLLLSVPRSRE